MKPIHAGALRVFVTDATNLAIPFPDWRFSFTGLSLTVSEL